MSLKPFLFSAFRQIVNKIHVSNILMKIAGIFYINDIGVMLYVLLCVGFGKFIFSDSAKKNMTVFLKHGIYILYSHITVRHQWKKILVDGMG